MTTDELFDLGLEHTRILAAMIDNGRSWYLGRRRRRLEEMISGYFDPKRGLGIDYLRKTIRHLANGGFKKVNMKSDAAVAFRKGNEHALALLRELEPLLAQHVGKMDESIRFVHMVDADFANMRVSVQPMGPFRDCLEGTAFRLRYEGQEISAQDAERLREEVEVEEEVVSPDQMITCPKCHKRFRVGKKIG